MNTSRADLHCHSTASAGVEARRPARARPAGVRDAAGGGLLARQAPRDGLRHDHRSRHDRRRPGDRRPAGRVRLRGADRAVHAASRRPCTSSASGSRRTTTSGCRRTPTTSRSSRTTCTSTRSPARWRIPFYAVEAPLLPRHRRRLAQLFDVWEVRNGSRAPELNHPAAIYVETHGGVGVGGCDDHAGVDIGRTWSETPFAPGPCGVPRAHPRRARRAPTASRARPPSGRTRRWRWPCARSGRGDSTAAPDPSAVLRMVERVMTEGDARSGSIGCDLGPEDGRALLRAWLDAVDLRLSERDLLALLQSDGFSHAALERRARRCHERGLRARGGARDRGAGASSTPPPRTSSPPASPRSPTRPPRPSSGARRASSRRATASRCGSRWSPTASAGCTASRTRWTRSASAACPASRSR